MHYYPVGLSTGNVLFHQSADASASFRKEEELFESAKEIEAQTIRNLLPDEDDLFSGVFNEVESCADSKGGDNTEDFDLFSSVGGMELEGDDASCAGKRGFDFAGGVFNCCGRSNGSLASTIKIGPSYCADSKHCMMQKCCKLEKDGAGVPKSTNGISSSKCMPGCFSNGSLKGSHSASNVPLTENTLSDRNSCVLNSFPSSLNASSAGNQFGLHIPSHSLDLVKFGSQYISSFESNSFPHCQNTLNAFIPHDSASTVANTAGSRVSERKNGRHISVVGPNGLPMELKGGMIGPFSNATCPVHGHHWSNCYSFPHNSFSHKVWLTSSLLPNCVNAPSSPPKPGCSAFCSGSVGSVGLCGSSPSHLIGRGSPEFSHAGSNCMKSSHGVLHSSRQSSHSKMVTSLPTSFGYPRECWRNISRRSNQGCYIHADKKKFELDIECILRGDDFRTTLMIKNIPNKYTSKMLLATINEHCRGIYDFVYLPIDFKNKCNVGYAFINLIGPLQIIPLYKAFNGKKWEKFNSEKVAAIAYARIQGKAALVAHFQNSSLMNEDKRCRPLLFCTVGPNAGEQEPFPMGTKTRSEAGKPRGGISEENHLHGSPSMSPNSTESDRGSVSPKSVIDQEA